MVLIPIKVPESEAKESVSPVNTLKRQLLGAAVLLALAAILLPLLLDGSGSESRFRRVENVREYPLKIIGADGKPESPQVAQSIAEPPVAAAGNAADLQTPTAPELPAAPKPQAPAVTKLAPVVDLKALAAAKLEELAAKPAEVTVDPQARRTSPSAEIDAALAQLGEIPADSGTVGQAAANTTALASDESLAVSAWVVQAGSFADEENAMRLRDQLRNRGFPSFLSTAGDRELVQTLRYRVQVGPLTDRLNVQQRQREIERITGRSTLVREYR